MRIALILSVALAACGGHLPDGSGLADDAADGTTDVTQSGGDITRPCDVTQTTLQKVIDGDTLQIAGGEVIRLLDVDAPEFTESIDCGGELALKHTQSLMPRGATIYVEYGPDCRDDFGRLLAYVRTEQGDVGAALVERGLACVYDYDQSGGQRVTDYTALQSQAQARGLGIWSYCVRTVCGGPDDAP